MARTESKVPEKITRQTLLSEIAEKYPETVPLLFDYGLHCLGCPLGSYETLEEGLRVHGLSEKEIDEVVLKMNQVIKNHSKKNQAARENP